MSPPRVTDPVIISTFVLPLHQEWQRRVTTIDPRGLHPIHAIARVLRYARTADAVILDGSGGAREYFRDTIAAALIARLRHPPVVIMTDSTWFGGRSWPAHTMRRLACRMMDGPHITFCVLSTAELRSFPATWGVDPARMRLAPWPYTIGTEAIERANQGSGSVFAGGDSHRDYDTFLAACRCISAPVTLGSRRLTDDQLRSLPPHVTAGPMGASEFDASLERASIVVVPLRPQLTRAAGQTTYVNAMALGKLVIVSDAPGVSDQIDHGKTGLIVTPGDVDELADALSWATQSANADAVAAITSRAREVALTRFSPRTYLARILEIADEAIANRRARGVL